MANLPTKRDGRARIVKVAGLLLLPILIIAALLLSQLAQIKRAAEAYLFGYPLVIMHVTSVGAERMFGAQNMLFRKRDFPDANAKAVVKPNVDTLYSSAFIDTLKGPWVFEMAANNERYEVMQFMDGWTNVFASLGTRTTGTGGGRFLLVGPGWQGGAPPGLHLLRAPTQMVWMLGRTQTNGAKDMAVVHRLQDGLQLRTLADWQAGKEAPSVNKPKDIGPAVPVEYMRDMSTEVFYGLLGKLMVNNPPDAADSQMLESLAQLGIKPGQPLQWTTLDRWTLLLGRWLAERVVTREVKAANNLLRGWKMSPPLLGKYGTDYGLRGAVAVVGLGANLPEDAVYPTGLIDHKGEPLNGRHRYRIHFNKSELPPVSAFWSVTAYGADDFLIANPLNRYALGDRDPLAFNADGSLDLWIQAAQPADGQVSNWLPVKAGEPFMLSARLYWPKQEVLNARWGMPSIERVGE